MKQGEEQYIVLWDPSGLSAEKLIIPLNFLPVAACHGELHLGDRPRHLHSQNLRIAFFVSHTPEGNGPIRSGEEPQ